MERNYTFIISISHTALITTNFARCYSIDTQCLTMTGENVLKNIMTDTKKWSDKGIQSS